MTTSEFLSRLSKKRTALIVVFFAYLAVAQLSGYLYGHVGTSPSVVLAPVGVSLAAFILEGYLVWPAIMLAAIVNGLITGSPLLLIFGSVVGNTLQPVLGLWVLRRLGFDRMFFSLKDMFAMIFTAFFSTMLVPTVNFLTVWLYNSLYHVDRPTYWLSWWLGGALSALAFTPVLMRWIRRPVTPRPFSRYVEIAVSTLLVVVSSYFIFATTYNTIYGFSLFYVLLAALFWLAFRGGVRFTTLALFLMTVISLGGALWGDYLPAAGGLTARITNTEVFDLIFAVFFFILVSLEEQRSTARKILSEHTEKLERALARIGREDEAKNEFIALLGHELRNPLAALLSSVEVMTIADPSPEERRGLLQQMNDRIRGMAHLLDDILDISRITQRKFILRREPVNAGEIAKRAVAAVTSIMQKQRHTLITDFPQEPLMLDADPTRLEQIMVNLLHNAAKYTPEGGRVEFRGQMDDGEVVITVTDTGIGILREMLSRIFEPFVQINSKLNRGGGIGVGLSLTKGLVELHDGTLSVKSEGENRGSEFTVRLPAMLGVMRASPDELPEELPQPSVPTTGSGLKILVVDDNEDAAQGLARLLNLRGHDTTIAYDGLHVTGTALSYQPDVIILDIGLPDIDGYEVARRLREAGVKATLIALSGYGQSEDKRKAKEAGFDFHLTKPIGLAQLEPLLISIPVQN